MKKALALLLGALVAAAPASAQQRHSYTHAGVVRIGVARDIDSLDPIPSGQAGVTDIAQFIFSGAIDWDALSRNVYLGVDLPGVNDIFPGSWASDPRVKRNPHDLERARALLDGAGWKPGSDGIRDKDGKRLAVDICTVAGIITRANAEVFIQQGHARSRLRRPSPQFARQCTVSSYGAGGIFATGKFDLGIYAWTKTPDPDDSESIGPDRVPPNGGNYSGLVDAQIGKLQTAAAQSYDRNIRRPLYFALQRRIQELLPYQTMVWRANINAYNSDLQNFKPAPAVSYFWNAAEWSM